ncbi:MAG: DUF115 domain-containing protein, partial [Candidatus Omnitrophica bacterium]|nr:DUF115 domain-containing protein [Candidatus Omnitrophota bacterium]
MHEKIFTQNIELLKKQDPSLAYRIETCVNDSYWEMVPTKTGSYTIRGKNLQGHDILLHSIYDPVREAQQLVSTYAYSPAADIVFLGFALGFHVHQVFKKKGKHGFILIAEKDIRIVRLAFEYIDLENILTMDNVLWSVDEPFPRLFNRLKEHALSILANGATVLEHPPSIKIFPDYYQEIKRIITEVYTWCKVNANTQIAKSEDFSRNVLANIPEIVKNPGVKQLFGAFENVPFFIASAGPSLDKNVHYLREVKNKGIVIAVDSALKTLLDKQIIPDVVVSIDFSTHNVKYFDEIDSEQLVLVFDPEVYPLIPKSFKGRKFVINLPGKSLCDWITALIGDKGKMEKGLSVSHTAFLLALQMGGNPIIFIGQDLSYPRGAWHSKGSRIYQRADIHDDLKARMILLKDYFGGEISSEISLRVFLNHFESMLEGLDRDCYNATEGGAAIKGMKTLSLREAIVRFCHRDIDKEVIRHALFPPAVIDDMQKIYTAGLRIVEKLAQYNHDSHEAFQCLDTMIKEIHKPKFDKVCVMDLYKQVATVIKNFNQDQEILNLIKDNAIEALLIRAQRETKTLSDINFSDKKEIQHFLQKEKMFFTVLIKATHFL